jgi:hypothetical protein
MVSNFEIDWSEQLVIATSSSDASVTIPVPKPIGLGSNPRASADVYWIIMVSGSPAYININAAATSANASMPVGIMTMPFRLPPGTVVHALENGGAGIVSLVRCFPVV